MIWPVESGAQSHRSGGGRRRARSAPEPQALDHGLIAARIGALQVVEQTAPLPNHHEKPTARMEILIMRRQMLGEVLDALAQDGDLHLGRTGIALFAGVIPDKLLLTRKREDRKSV